MLPVTAAALSSAEQPSVVVPAGIWVAGSAGSATSVPTTTSPVTPAAVTGGPNDASPAKQIFAMLAGELITTMGLGFALVVQTPTSRAAVMSPSSPSWRPLMRSTVSPQMSE